jgi:protocatechuate 3,4-dioxygenase beta subunit
MRGSDRRIVVGLALLALAVGLAVWLLGSSDEPAAGVAKGEARAPQAAAELPAPPEPLADAAGAAPQSLLSADEQAAAHVAAASGEALSFTGRVIDEAGRPLPDALVTHWPTQAFRKLAGLPLSARWAEVPFAKLAATRTDKDGHFRLDSRELPPERAPSFSLGANGWGSYSDLGDSRPHLLVEHAGFGAEDVEVASTHAGLGELGDIVLHEELAVSGRLLDEHGQGVGGVRVGLRPMGDKVGAHASDLLNQRLVADSDEAGRFRLQGVPKDRWELHGEPAGYEPFQQSLPAEAAGAVDLGDIALKRGAALAGRVIDADGHPVAGAEVQARMSVHVDGVAGPDRAAAMLKIRVNSNDRFWEPRVRTEPDGSFVLSGLWSQVDSFRITASADGLDPACADDVPPGKQDLELVLQPRATWRLQLADAADHRPVAGASLKVWRMVERSEDWASSIEPVRDDDDWLLAGAGRWRTRVIASAPGHATTITDLPGLGAGESRQQLVELPRELAVDGRVVDETGAPVAQASVRLRPPATTDDYASLPERLGVSGADGSFHIGQLSPGDWSCTASAAGHLPRVRPLTVSLAADKTPPPLELVLPAGGRISGLLRDAGGAPVARASVTAKCKDQASFVAVFAADGAPQPTGKDQPRSLDARTSTGADGTFAFDGLPPGSWWLDGGLGAEAAAELSAHGAVEITLVRHAPPRVEGRVLAGGAPAVGVAVELFWDDEVNANRDPRAATRTDASGHYELSFEGVGAHAVRARDGQSFTPPVAVDLALDGLVHADLAFGGGGVTGRVLLAGARTPLPGVRVSLQPVVEKGAKLSPAQVEATTDADGHFAFERVPAGPWKLNAINDLLLQRAPQAVQVDEAPQEFTLELVACGAVDVALGDAIAWGNMAMVELRPAVGTNGAKHSFTPTQPTHFSRVEPGEYTIIARRQEGKGWVDVASEKVTVEAGKPVTLRLPR